MPSEKAAEVLVEAGLNGVKQVRHNYHDGQGGLCGLGVLIKAIIPNFEGHESWGIDLAVHYPGLTGKDCSWIQRMNDFEDMDFLSIGRKLNNREEI